jgi:hypothetical protein
VRFDDKNETVFAFQVNNGVNAALSISSPTNTDVVRIPDLMSDLEWNAVEEERPDRCPTEVNLGLLRLYQADTVSVRAQVGSR